MQLQIVLGQKEIRSGYDFVPGYKLIYGNQENSTFGFEPHLNGFLILNRTDDAGKVILKVINQQYLQTDSLIIKGWPSNELWQNGKDYFYRPTILYTNEFCEVDGRKTRKEIIVKIILNDYKIDDITCLIGQKNLRNDEVYEYKDIRLIISESKKGVHYLNIYRDDKLILERKATTMTEEKNPPFIIERSSNGFGILNAHDLEMIKVDKDIHTLEGVLNDNLNLSEYRIQLSYDRQMDTFYLFNVPLHDEENAQLELFKLVGDKFIKSEYFYKKSYYNKVIGNKLYSVFDVKREDGDFNGIFSTPISD